MADKSKIEWTDATWTIVQGCDPVSPGCTHCYVGPLLWRMMHHPDPKISGPLQGLIEKHVNAAGETILRFTGKLALREDRLTWPLRWKEPRMIFVPSHGDLFHHNVPDSFIDKVFAVMALCPQHTFQVLTKRAERMREYLTADGVVPNSSIEMRARWYAEKTKAGSYKHILWPLPNVWLGVSAERQQEADERIPHLLNTPAAVRFVSCEPLLGPIDLRCITVDGDGQMDALVPDTWEGVWEREWKDKSGQGADEDRAAFLDWYNFPPNSELPTGQLHPCLDWVIVGGENGQRPMHPDWARSLHNQCAVAGVAFFFKQYGSHASCTTATAMILTGGAVTLSPAKRRAAGGSIWQVGMGSMASGLSA